MMFNKDKSCPLRNGPCIKGDCAWYVKVRGKHPQTDAPLEEGMCAPAAMVIGQFEQARTAIRTEAAIEDFKNKNSEVNHTALSALKAIGIAMETEQQLQAGMQLKLINGNSQ